MSTSALTAALSREPWPVRTYPIVWTLGKLFNFAMPAAWLASEGDDDVVPGPLLGLTTTRKLTFGWEDMMLVMGVQAEA